MSITNLHKIDADAHSQDAFPQRWAMNSIPVAPKPGPGDRGMWTRGQATDVSILQRARRG